MEPWNVWNGEVAIVAIDLPRRVSFSYPDGRMTVLRQRVRVVAMAWLLCQAASLAAFVPEQCCLSHAAEAAAKAKTEACHETAAEPAQPDPKEGDACPMHHGSKSHDCCVLTNACDGPGSHLLSLFAFSGVIEAPIVSSVELDSVLAFIAPPPSLNHQFSLPDAPPPKS
jgi:hypothetical protein